MNVPPLHPDIGDIRITMSFKPAKRTLRALHYFIIEGQEQQVIGAITGSEEEVFRYNPIKQRGEWKRLKLNLDTFAYEEEEEERKK